MTVGVADVVVAVLPKVGAAVVVVAVLSVTDNKTKNQTSQITLYDLARKPAVENLLGITMILLVAAPINI